MHAMGVGHVTRHNAWHIRNETSVVSLGLGGLRDRSGTEGRTSHNNILILVVQGMAGGTRGELRAEFETSRAWQGQLVCACTVEDIYLPTYPKPLGAPPSFFYLLW